MWKTGGALIHELRGLSKHLQQFDHDYTYEGDKLLEAAFGLERSDNGLFTDLKPFYKEGTLVIYNGVIGNIESPDVEYKQAVFHPLISGQQEIGFFERYIAIRDNYLQLAASEASDNIEYAGLRAFLNKDYEQFVSQYGPLNYPGNRKLITNDAAFGFTMLSSLERKEGEHYVKSDILVQSLIQKQEQFRTDDPVEALARCLNETGKVSLDFIEAATGLTEAEIISKLDSHI